MTKSILTKFVCIFILILTPPLNIALQQGYTNAAIWLYARSPLPEKIDYLCSFAGDRSREIYALQLYKRYSPVWIASTIDRKMFKKWAYQNGVDTNKIIVTDKCESTLDEIRFFKSQIESHHLLKATSLAFISSPLHMRRILIYNSLINHDRRLHIYSLPVPLEHYGLSQELLKKWQYLKPISDIVYLEFFKMAGGIISANPFFGTWFNGKLKRKLKVASFSEDLFI